MTEKKTAEPVTLSIDVDTSGLERAAQLMERLAAAAKEARAALACLSAVAPPDDIVRCTVAELRQDETPAQILAELKGLRRDLAQQHDMVNAVGIPLRTA